MSEQFLATASVRIVPDVTGFAAALQAEVAAATKAVSTGATAAAGATAGLTAAQKAQTIATNRLVGSTEILNITKKQQATLDRIAARAADIQTASLRRQAVTTSQVSRGLATATASQFGLRGAVLASTGPFLAAVVGIETLRKSIDEASAEQEAAARVTAILGGEVGKSAEEWGKQQAAIGLSTVAALKYAGAIEQVFRNVGIASDQNAKFSEDLVKRATDIAARSNVPVTQVLRALQLALSGNLRGLRQFVPAVDAATIAQRALADTGKTVKAELTTQELVLARYEVIMARSANQAGAFAERQGHLAGQSKILQSNIANLAAELGTLATPVLTTVATGANTLFSAIGRLKGGISDIIGPTKDAEGNTTLLGNAFHFLGDAAKFSALGVFGIAARFDELSAGEETATLATHTLTLSLGGPGGLTEALSEVHAQEDAATLASLGLAQAFGAVGDAWLGLATVLKARLLFQPLREATNQAESTAAAAARVEATGGSPSAILAAQTRARQAAEKELAAADALAKKRPTSKAAQTRQREAVDALNAARQAEESTRAGIAADAKSAASAAEAARKAAEAAAKAARQAHDQQIQTDIADAQFISDRAHLKAQRTKSLVDDLAADKLTLKIIDQQIILASAILDATTRKQKLQELTLAREQASQQIQADKAAQIQRQKDHRDLIRDRTGQRLELDIEIAQTKKNTSAEVAAREARIRFDQEQLKSVHGDIVRKKQLQLEIAQDTQAIKDLKKKTDENLSAQAQFQFLTTEAGFVANLLGNLIPRGATAGLVGGTAGAISTPTVARPATALSAAAQTAGGPRGASTGQMATLIHVQMQMLQAILRLTGQRAHPEATYQRYSAADDLNVATST